jgi:transposase-like protein
MSKRKRRQFSAQEKVALLRLHLIEKKPVSEICDAHRLNPNVFYRWQKDFFENGARAFEKDHKSSENAKERKIQELERKLADRDEGIAELMMDHVLLKKKLGLS